MQVYGDFLDASSALHFKRLANQTAPFVPSDLPEGSFCVQGLELEDQFSAQKVRHRFGVEITKGRDLLLVDPIEQAKSLQQREATLKNKSGGSKEELAKISESVASDYGFLVLTEIVFDKSRRFAVLKYLYFCGTHCDYGATFVMEKVGTSWTEKTRRPCTQIIN